MLHFNWKRWLTNLSARRASRQELRRKSNPRLEHLEDRITPTHFRYGTFSWQPLVGANVIRFRLEQAWQWDFPFPSGARPAVGSTVTIVNDNNTNLPLNFGDGQSTNIALTVTSINAAQDLFVGTETIDHTYTTPGTYTAFIDGSARSSALVNNASGEFRMETAVNAGTSNFSPITSLEPIIQVSQGGGSQFQIPATDPDGDNLTYRLATSSEAGGAGGFTQPSQVSINSSTGVVQWNGAGTSVGQEYSVQFVIEDHATINGPVVSKTPVDVLLQVVPGTQLQPTINAAPPGPFFPQAGTTTPLTFMVNANVANPGSQSVSVQILNAPAGMTAKTFASGT